MTIDRLIFKWTIASILIILLFAALIAEGAEQQVYLFWQFDGATIKEVDAFMSKEQCEDVKRQAEAVLAQARLARPELASFSFSRCEPVNVPQPSPERKSNA